MFTVWELICGQKKYLQHFFDKLNMLAISVAIKMSIAPTKSNQKILRKMGISENQVFIPKWNNVEISEIFCIY